MGLLEQKYNFMRVLSLSIIRTMYIGMNGGGGEFEENYFEIGYITDITCNFFKTMENSAAALIPRRQQYKCIVHASM